MRLLIIADDLSGAADCAIGFSSSGHRTVVALNAALAPADADVVAADTDSRRLVPAEAAARTVAAFNALRAHGGRLYKKIDSTLRGNWAAEVAALGPLAGLAIVAPAFPATGRTTRGARVYVHGAPLETTETWQLEHAGREADIVGMLAAEGLTTQRLGTDALRQDAPALVRRIAEVAMHGADALIVDAECDDDLRKLARATAAMEFPLFWVGSGGLARELAALERGTHAADAAAVCRCEGPILVLAGSLSAICERQCAMLRERAQIIEHVVPSDVLRARAAHPQWTAWQARMGAALDAGSHLLIRIGRDAAFDPAEGARLSAALAALVHPHFTKIGGLVATGGETARAMLGAVGIGTLQLLTEVEAGVVVAQALDARFAHRPAIVTKAGAFGTDQALYAAWLRLTCE